jgi:hypothetical protein
MAPLRGMPSQTSLEIPCSAPRVFKIGRRPGTGGTCQVYDGGGLIPIANGPRRFRRAASLTSCSVHSHDYAVGQTKGRKVRSVPVPTFVLEELSL